MAERKEQSRRTEEPARNWHREIIVAYESLNSACDFRKKKVEEASIPFREGVSAAFEDYSDYLREFLPIEHGAVLLSDNGVSRVYETSPEPMKIKGFGTLFGNMMHFHYPTRKYFFPDSHEVVDYLVHYRDQFPGESKFGGFDQYRKSGAYRFSKVVNTKGSGIQQVLIEGEKKELEETLELIESKLVDDPRFSAEVLEEKRQNVINAFEKLQKGVFKSKKENLKPLFKRLGSLIEALEQNNVARLSLKKSVEVGRPFYGDDKMFVFPEARKFVVGKRVPGFLGPLGWLSVKREATPEEVFDHVWEISDRIIRRAIGVPVSRIRRLLEDQKE